MRKIRYRRDGVVMTVGMSLIIFERSKFIDIDEFQLMHGMRLL